MTGIEAMYKTPPVPTLTGHRSWQVNTTLGVHDDPKKLTIYTKTQQPIIFLLQFQMTYVLAKSSAEALSYGLMYQVRSITYHWKCILRKLLGLRSCVKSQIWWSRFIYFITKWNLHPIASTDLSESWFKACIREIHTVQNNVTNGAGRGPEKYFHGESSPKRSKNQA